MLRTSIRLNNDVTIGEVVAVAEAAERHGFDQLWVSGDLFFRSAPVLLAAAAGVTSQLGLGTCVLNPASMHPAEIAMVAVTMQELTGDRFALGLAAGATEALGWAGIERSQPLAATRQAVVAIRALCSGEAPADVRGAGERWSPAARMRIPPRPTPIYLGAMSPRMRALIGEVADGGLPLLYPPEHVTAAMADVDAGCRRAGRSTDDVDVAACVWVSVAAERVAAEAPLAAKLAYFGPSFADEVLARAGVDRAGVVAWRDGDPASLLERVPPGLLALGIAGTPADVVERCRPLVAAGARHVSFGPPLGPDPVEAVRLLGTEVVPALRAER